MLRLSMLFSASLLLSTFIASAAETFVLERPAEMRIDLREHIGKTYYQTLVTPIVGIDAEIDQEIYRPVTLLSGADIADFAQANFDPDVTAKLYDYLTSGRAGFEQAMAGFAGQVMVPGQFRELMRVVITPLSKNASAAGRANGGAIMLALLASGSGTLVILDANNYLYNAGYQDPDPTTGRSFAASGARKLLDASHNGYLDDLSAMLTASGNGAPAFFTVLFDILTATDTRGLASLPPEQQVVISDFLATYTAELERHQMVDLGLSSPWEIDYAQVTLLADYTGLSGMVMVGPDFVPGKVDDYAKGSIGTFKKQFTRISRLITTYLSHPDEQAKLIDRILELTPISDPTLAAEVRGDIFRRVLYFLNNDGTQFAAQQNGTKLRDAMVDLLAAVRASHAEITAFAKKCVADQDLPDCFGARL
jgi:hypothetical protein